MGVVRGVVNFAARRAKRDRTYTINPSLPLRALFAIARERSGAALHGMLYARFHFAESRGITFLGRGVKFSAPYKIHAGRSLTIDDYAVVDALSEFGVFLADNVKIGRFATIKCTGVLTHIGKGLIIGENSNIGDYNYITGDGGIRIGAHVMLAPFVKIHAENHNFGRLDIPIKAQGVSSRGVLIEDDCWIGAGAIILDGVTLGRGSVVAAGAVVTKSAPPYSIVAGIPAKVIRSRLPADPQTQYSYFPPSGMQAVDGQDYTPSR
jgi:acetyltransferase-like isoleucine patch superfamily enzyme